MDMTRMGRAVAIAVAALAVWGAALSTVAPAAADTGASVANGSTSTPPPLTDQARSAIRAVRAYLEYTPKPVPPSDGAIDQYDAYERAALAWITEFPFEAGVAQWGCTAIDWEHSLIPSSDGGPDRITSWWVIHCPSGYRPAYSSFFTARPDDPPAPVEDSVAAASAPFMDVCLLILNGDHCFLYDTDPVTGQSVYEPTYFWTGDGGPAHGRLRVGSVPAIWPACSAGSTVTTLPVQSLPKGTGMGAAFPPAPGTVKSVIWEDADAGGNIIGIRSIRCNLEPGP